MEIMEEKIKVAESMKEYGGSFMKALGEALLHADPFNAQKIKDMWPADWKKYKDW